MNTLTEVRNLSLDRTASKYISLVQAEILRATDRPKDYSAYSRCEKDYLRPIAVELLARARSGAQCHFLHVGAGYGTLSVFLAKLGYLAHVVDMSDNFAVPLRELYGVDFRIQDVESKRLPFTDNVLSVVLLTEVLEHFKGNPLPVIQDIYRVLHPGGTLYLSTPKPCNSEFELRQVLTKAGFTLTNIVEQKPRLLHRFRSKCPVHLVAVATKSCD